MYIKQIIIQGFKSYKEQTVIEPFSPKTNVIVGRNGSGKSNFFAAIRFVLSDAYSQMGREERQALLHEGSGSAVMSAYVEIIFDNSDDRFPTGKEELILRRTIGLKKDEYSLDRKNATKTDVMNLLESAGFSRSNPYYIVPQGRVTALTNMKDSERLNLLKEVAGTQVYEARRTESLKIMTETSNKRGKIDESLEYIKERLAELEEEKEELRGYQEKDKDRRCLEYAFYHREQTALAAALDEIEEMRRNGLDGSDENRESFLAGEKAVLELDNDIKTLTRQMELLKLERSQLEEDRRDISKSQAKLELNVKNFADSASATEQAKIRHQQELKSIKQEIKSKENELAKLLPDYTKRKARETEVKNNLDFAEASRTRLFNKQGRAARFKNRAERDSWLKSEIETLSTALELLDVNEIYRTATEQSAGASLFHYVVDNTETATFLVNKLFEERGGRVTFIPMDKVAKNKPKLPNASDAIVLLDRLKFDPKYKRAMEHVFGKTIVCPSLTIAAQYARSHQCNAITPDGDTANRKGAMTGGYIDPSKSRLQAVRALEKWREEYDALEARSDALRKDCERKDNEINHALSELHKLEQKLSRLDDSFDPLKMELRAKNIQLEKLRTSLEANVRQREVVDQMIRDHGDSISALEAELSADFKKALTADEERQLELLNTRVQDLQQQWNDLSKSRREVEGRKQLLEVDLRENLRRKLDQLNSQEIDATVEGGSGNLKEAERELKRVQRTAETIESRLQETETQIEDAENNISSLVKERAQILEQQLETAKAIEKAQKKMEKSVAKKALLTSSAAECAKNIRDLGVLPDEAFEKYADKDSKYITSKLKKVNDALKKYKGVNKKAFEQYNNFTTQREGLIKRRKELDDGLSSIQDLVEVLDQRKDEAIERTFKQVSKEFAQIFERLVPAGRGRLIIQRKTDHRTQANEDSDEEPRGEGVENYTGVGISVSFNSKHDDQQRIQQLSGGQKSLCALALFICTTFRPEMLLVADKCYGVTFHNKTSGIGAVSREEALKFVDGEAPK
ncbi:chromosome segregation protein sudA [Diplocarpon rosae]|nr:chromosome segregation protein sudA [Diplocarpon rosae]